MKFQLSSCVLFLLTAAAASAQVASHAPTILSQQSHSTSAPALPDAVGKPVATVNGSVLTEADLVREEYAIFPYASQHNGIPKDLAPQIRSGALKMIIFEELVYQEALRRNMTVPPVKMQHAEADFRKQFPTPEEFNAMLQGEFHGSLPLLREKIRRSLLIDSLLKTEIQNKGAVTVADVKAYYDKNPARFQHPETFTFQTISVLPPAKPTADQLKEGHKRIDAALRQAKATKSADEFGLLAEKISDDDYRVMMGEHKPVTSDQLAPQVLKALTSMKSGDVSEVIQIDQAYTIVRLQDHTPAGKQKFQEVKTQLQTELQKQKTNQLRIELDKKLRQSAKVQEL